MRLLHLREETAARMDDNLRKTVMVAKVHEKDAAMVAETEHPSGKTDNLTRVRGAEFIACMGTIRMHNFNLPSKKIRWYYSIY